MKRVWSQVDSDVTVHRKIGTVKRRKVNAIDFPVHPLNEDVWCQILKHLSPEQATILRMVCKYFRIERFVVKAGDKKEKAVKHVCKEAIIGTNNPEYIQQLPGIRLTQEKLRILKTRCHKQDHEVEVFKFAVACGVPMKGPDWYAIAKDGSRKALDWVKSLPIPWVTSRKTFMPGLCMRGDYDTLVEFSHHLNYQWNEERLDWLLNVEDEQGLNLFIDYVLGKKSLYLLGYDDTYAICAITKLIRLFRGATVEKRADAKDKIEKIVDRLNLSVRAFGETRLNLTLIPNTCTHFRSADYNYIYVLIAANEITTAYLVWRLFKHVVPLAPYLRALVAAPTDTSMLIRAAYGHLTDFTEERREEFKNNPQNILTGHLLNQTRRTVYGSNAQSNPGNLACYMLYPDLPAAHIEPQPAHVYIQPVIHRLPRIVGTNN